MCLQSLESAAHRTHALKKKSVREGVTSNLAAASEKLLQDLQRNGVIGEFELDSACLSILAKLPSNQQTQVRLLPDRGPSGSCCHFHIASITVALLALLLV